jgi:hypothetical protein
MWSCPFQNFNFGCELEMKALALKGEPLAVDSLDALRSKPMQSRFIGV